MASVAAAFRRKKDEPPPAEAAQPPVPPGPEPPPTPTVNNRPTLARKLAGATVLQILPALRDDETARTALNVTAALLRIGARAIVAAEGGALVSHLQSLGAEWLKFRSPNINLATAGWLLGRNTRRLEDLIVAEHVDIIHAYGASAALSARAAAMLQPVWLITTLPSEPIPEAQLGKRHIAALVHGHRVMTQSAYAAIPVVEHYGIPRNRIAIVPPAMDITAYDPTKVDPAAIAELRAAWQIQPDERVVLVPGAITPASGHLNLVDAARILVNRREDNFVVVIPGVAHSKRRDFGEITRRAKLQGVDDLFCLGSPAGNQATLLAAADVVVVPALAPQEDGSLIAAAQAMAKPVITTAVGVLPEYLLAPPRMPEDLRTGWLVRPGDPVGLARAISDVLALDDESRHALGARAWQFAHSTFSANGVAADTLAVYTSLLDNGS